MPRFQLPSVLTDHRGPWLAACLPALCAVIFTLTGSQPQTLANVPELPSLAFDQYLVDLRRVAPAEEVFAYFGFKNVGTVPVTITKLEPSCGCLTPQLRKRVYQPGEQGEFLLRVKTALQRPGLKEFSVKVHFTDSEPRSRDVFLRAVFPEKQIYVQPMSLTFHQMGTSPVEQDILVTDLRAAPSEILGVESTTDLVELKVLDAVTTKNGARQQRVRVTVPGAVPSGRHIASIKIYTDDHTFHELKIPIQIFGPEKRSVLARYANPSLIGPARQ